MKKLFFLLVLFMACATLSSKEKPQLSIRILYPYSEGLTNEYEDSIIRVYFDVSEKALYLIIHNKTNKRIYLEWENFRIDNSAIAFDTDRRIKMDEPKSDEYISAWWDIDKIKKMGEQFSKVIIPIRVNDKNIDYVFQIGVACIIDGDRSNANIPTKEKIDSIHEGMRYEDVISLIGYPNSYSQIDKSFTAHYFNGLSVEFQAAYKIHAEVLSHYWTPNTINIGLKGRKKTIVSKVDTSKMHEKTPEQYFAELYK